MLTKQRTFAFGAIGAIGVFGVIAGPPADETTSLQGQATGASLDRPVSNDVSYSADEFEAVLQIAQQQLDGGATSLVVGGGPEHAAAAAALAGSLGAPALIGDAAVDDVIDLISPYPVDHLYLLSYEDDFETDELEALESSVSEFHPAFGETSLDVSVAALDFYVDDATVIALAPDDGSEVRATTWALARGLPVISYAHDEPDDSFLGLAEAYAAGTIMIFGGVEELPAGFTGMDWEGEATTYEAGQRPEEWLDDIVTAIEVGRSPGQVIVAPAEQDLVVQQAAALAASEGGVYQSVVADDGFDADSDALRTLQVIGDEVDSVDLVGAGVVDGDLQDLLDAATETRTTAPAAFVSGMSAWDEATSLEIEAPVGTETIEAYNIEGSMVGSTTSTSLELDVEPQALHILLLGTDGDEMGAIEFKTNHSEGDGSAFDVAASEYEGTFHVQMNVSNHSPRLVMAHGRDIVDGSVTSLPIAVTCEAAVSFDVPDPSLEWRIQTHDFVGGQSHPACGGESINEAETMVAGTTFPPALLPAEHGAGVSANQERAARPTTLDQMLMQDAEHAESGVAAIPPFYFRYETFIEPEFIYTPAPQINTFWRFNGDNRTVHQSGSVKVLVDTRVQFDGTTPTYEAEIGETLRWSCRGSVVVPGCIGPERDRSSGNSISVTGTTTSTSADFNVSFAEPNPLFPGAPNIDADVQFKIRTGASTVSGTHDGMPTHAIWFGPAESHYHLIYASDSWSPECLAGSLPGCTVYVQESI